MNPVHVPGALVDPTKPAGPKWGDPGFEAGDEAAPVAALDPNRPFTPTVGDSVVLKSGGPAMTVIGTRVPGEDDTINCQWFHPIDHGINSQKFLRAALTWANDDLVWKAPVTVQPGVAK